MNVYSNTGGVTVIPELGFPASVLLTSYIYGDQNYRVFITGIEGENSAGHQFLHTLSHFIYIYVFGERIGTLTIKGKMVLHPCIGYNGVRATSDYYAVNRITNIGSPLAVSVGGVVVNGFLVKLNTAIQDPTVPFGDFVLTFKTVPY